MPKILIVDDLSSIREFLNINLSSEPDIEVIGLADNGKGAIAQVEEHQPDIVLMDINMPGAIDGIQATEKIVRRFPQTKILLLTSQDDRQQLERALQAGSRGYILKNTSIKDITNIIRLAEKGFFQIGPIMGSWDGSLHSSMQMNATKLAIGEKGLGMDTIISPKFNYPERVERAPEMNHTLSDLSSKLFQLQETIKSQKDTIANLSSQHYRVQRQANNKSSRKVARKSYDFNVYSSRPSKSRTQKRQHLLFISSFLLGVITVLVLVLLVMVVG